MTLRRALPAALALLVGATTFAIALASSSVGELILVGRPWRWVQLGALCVVAVAAAALLGRRARLPLLAYALPLGLVAVAYASTAWSVDPSLSAKRATTLFALFVAGAALATAAAGRPELVRAVLLGLLLGATALAVGGLLVLAFAHGDAIQHADTQSPARYQGLGGNPNTAAMLLALGVPLALWVVLEERRLVVRALAGAALALLVGSIVASGSRGAMIGALVASLVLVASATRSRLRLVLAGAVAAVFVGGVLVSQIPKPLAKRPGVHRTGPPPPAVARNATSVLPLDGEIGAENGRHPSIRRRLFGSSGRSQAWGGALHTAAHRPVAGYGFGTEERAFVDRYYAFDSGRPENSYIGALLQLGAVGLVLLLALPAWALWRYARRPGGLAAPAAACLAGGLVLGITQSYLFSVGSDAAPAVWLAWFMLVAAAAPSAPPGPGPHRPARDRAPESSSAPRRGGRRSRG